MSTNRPINGATGNKNRQAFIAATEKELMNAGLPHVLADDGRIVAKAVKFPVPEPTPERRPTVARPATPAARPSAPPSAKPAVLVNTPLGTAAVEKLKQAMREADRVRLEIELGAVGAVELARQINVSLDELAPLISKGIIPPCACRTGKHRFYWNQTDVSAIRESVARHRGHK